jgi:hypothetical protein
VCTAQQLKELDIYQFEISLAKKKGEEREGDIEKMGLGETSNEFIIWNGGGEIYQAVLGSYVDINNTFS